MHIQAMLSALTSKEPFSNVSFRVSSAGVAQSAKCVEVGRSVSTFHIRNLIQI